VYGSDRISYELHIVALSPAPEDVTDAYPRKLEAPAAAAAQVGGGGGGGGGGAMVAAEAVEFTAEEKAESIAYRQRRNELSQAGRLVEFSRRQKKLIPLASPVWNGDESWIMQRLQAAGLGFKQAWRDFLQYAFLTRSEASTSNVWYQIKKCVNIIVATTAESKLHEKQRAFVQLKRMRNDVFEPGSLDSIPALENCLHHATQAMLKYQRRFERLTSKDCTLEELRELCEEF